MRYSGETIVGSDSFLNDQNILNFDVQPKENILQVPKTDMVKKIL